MATQKRKVVKTVTFSGTTLGILTATTGAGLSIEEDSAAAFGDEMFTQVPRVVASPDDLTLECIDEGENPGLTTGDVDTFTITLTYWNGSTQEKTKTVSKECSVKSISFGTAQVDGDRKATVSITLAPVGGVDLSAWFPASGGGH